MSGQSLIQVTQLPVIEERLRSVKDDVDSRVSEAVSLVCTEETVKAVKAARSDLNKQFQELERQRKAVKSAVLEPYERFESVYRECVSNAFRDADAKLKAKIDSVESEMKQRCEDELREYFSELCAAQHVEWLGYERAGVRVDMASARQKTPKKLLEQLVQFVSRVSSDVERISEMEGAEEILVEYKRTLNAVDAIGVVHERHRRIESERAAQGARAVQRERESEAIARVEAVAPPVILEEKEPERFYKCAFTVRATMEKLKKLKKFLIEEGIEYE